MLRFETIEIIDREFQTVKIPKNIDRFLFDYKNSEFLECSLVKPLQNYLDDTGTKYKYNKTKEISISQKLVYVNSVLESFLKDYSISGAILNGWLNDCEIDPSIKQVDLSLDGFDFDPQIIRHFNNDKKIPFSQINFDNQTLEIKMSNSNDFTLSISFSYNYNNTHRWLHQKNGSQIFKNFVHNYEPLCSAELMSAKILVPCNFSYQKVNSTKSILMKKMFNS